MIIGLHSAFILLLFCFFSACVGDSPVSLPSDNDDPTGDRLEDGNGTVVDSNDDVVVGGAENDPGSVDLSDDGSDDRSIDNGPSLDIIDEVDGLLQENDWVEEMSDVGLLFINRKPLYDRYVPKFVEMPGSSAVYPFVENKNASLAKPGEKIEFHALAVNRFARDISGGTLTWSFSDGHSSIAVPFSDFKANTIKDFGLKWTFDPSEIVDITVTIEVVQADFTDLYPANNTITIRTNANQIVFNISKGADISFEKDHQLLGLAGPVDWIQEHIRRLNELLSANPKVPMRVYLHDVFFRDNNDDVFKPYGGREDMKAYDHYVGLDFYSRPNFLYDTIFGLESTQTILDGLKSEWISANKHHQGFFDTFFSQMGLVDPTSTEESAVERSVLNNLRIRASQIELLYRGQSLLDADILRSSDGQKCSSSDCLVHQPEIFGAFEKNDLISRSPFFAGIFASRFADRFGYIGDYFYAVPKQVEIRFIDSRGLGLKGAKVLIYQSSFSAERKGILLSSRSTGEYSTDETGTIVLANLEVVNPDGGLSTATGFLLEANPFGQIDAYGRNGVLLLLIEKDGLVDVRFIDITICNSAFFRGETERTEIIVETNLLRNRENDR